MNIKVVIYNCSSLLFMLAILLTPSFVLSLIDQNPWGSMAYGLTISFVLFNAILFRKWGNVSDDLHRKDAFGVVAFIWLALGIYGGLPFFLEGSISSYSSAIFESVSGFTTTGATVISNFENISRATHLWRALSHWIGGMGIVVLFVAVFPQLGIGAKQLFKTEAPGPTNEGLKPKIKQTALRLWWIYAWLTLICLILLWWSGMTFFESLCHSFSILSTGGFSTKGDSIGGFHNNSIEWITIVFMFAGGLNFSLYYSLAKGHVSTFWKNYEFRFFVALNLLIGFTIFILNLGTHEHWIDSLRGGLFQTVAITTTTGLMTEDFDKYPDLARFLLFGCMFVGGCAGSTAGGLKASRIVVIYKTIRYEIMKVLHPQAVHSFRISGHVISYSVVNGILLFFAAYFLLFFVSSIMMVFLGLDIISAMSAVVACLSSVGPGLAQVGPVQNYEFIPGIGKLILSFCMIAGRLEIFVLFAVFSPECWKK